jgi:hypothetical protein
LGSRNAEMNAKTQRRKENNLFRFFASLRSSILHRHLRN